MSRRLEPDAESLAWARKQFPGFHWGDAPTRLSRLTVPTLKPGEVLYKLGDLVEVAYATHKEGRRAEWFHPFEGRLPVLAYSHSGQLVILGGSYRVTERGIVG